MGVRAAAPIPLNRSDFGINEQVNFRIDPSSWEDQDYYVDPYGIQSVVYDSMGPVTWSATGAGTVYPLTGNNTTLTVGGVEVDSPVSVQAEVQDSGTKGLDQLVMLQAGGGGMMAWVPTGIQLVQLESDRGLGVLGPPNRQIGAFSRVSYQVTPATVNFTAVPFQENIPAVPTPPAVLNWPDGTAINYPARLIEFNVSNVVIGGVLSPNWVLDQLWEGPYPIGRLGAPPAAFNFDIPVPLEFFPGIPFLPQRIAATNNKVHPREFKATTQTRVGLNPGGGTVWGGLQGPWQ